MWFRTCPCLLLEVSSDRYYNYHLIHAKLRRDLSQFICLHRSGYLAFIGYFCLEAGIGLTISESMTTVKDWGLLLNGRAIVLASPALVSGLLLTWLSRNSSSDWPLPLAMIAIPGVFYFGIWIFGVGFDGARDAGWVGGRSKYGSKYLSHLILCLLTVNVSLFCRCISSCTCC